MIEALGRVPLVRSRVYQAKEIRMLVHGIAWVAGALLILLTLAYAAIFTAMLAAKFRQTHPASNTMCAGNPIRGPRGAREHA